MTCASADNHIEAVLLTPPGDGGISVIAVTGRGAAALVASHLKTRTPGPVELLSGKLRYALFADSARAALDEVIVSCVDADRVEINCHGGIIPARRVLDELKASGVAISGPGAARVWDLAAPDLASAEAFRALCEARTDLAARVLAAQYGGLLSRELRGILDDIDAPDGLKRARERLGALQRTAALGMALTRPAVVAVVGPVNAGKSSIVNRLAGYERSIVTDVPGTTRDSVSVAASLCGVPVMLTDTAGAGDSADPLAAEACVRARRAADSAGAILAVFDARRPGELAPLKLPHGVPAVFAANKIDLAAAGMASLPVQGGKATVATSALTGQGIDQLRVALLGALDLEAPGADVAQKPVIFSARQACLVEKALVEIDAGRTAQARSCIAAILTGTPEDKKSGSARGV